MLLMRLCEQKFVVPAYLSLHLKCCYLPGICKALLMSLCGKVCPCVLPLKARISWQFAGPRGEGGPLYNRQEVARAREEAKRPLKNATKRGREARGSPPHPTHYRNMVRARGAPASPELLLEEMECYIRDKIPVFSPLLALIISSAS